MPDKIKTINYRGGLATFRLPAHWAEEYEQDGGGMFYEPGSDSNTLRINVLTMEAPDHIPVINQQAAIDSLSSLRHPAGVKPEALASGNALLRYAEPATEDGHNLIMHRWEIANPVPPRHMRIACFSLTTLESDTQDQKTLALIELLDEELRQCTFWPDLGEMSKKRWWEFWK